MTLKTWTTKTARVPGGAALAVAALIAGGAGGANAAPTSETTTSTVFRVESPDRIVLSGWDDAPPEAERATNAAGTTTTPPLATITVEDFEVGRNFRDRILLAHEPILTTSFAIPDHATTLTIVGRSRPAGGVFPRVQIRLITPDNNRHRLYDGYWATLSLEPRAIPLTEFVKGKQVQLEMEIVNPGVVEEERTFYFLRGEVR